MKPTPAQLANLRPISADPARASAQAKKTGFGTGTAKQCEHIKRDGQQCGGVAAYGSPKCLKHGARRYAGTPASPWPHLWAASKSLAGVSIPVELIRQDAWKAASGLSARKRGPRLVALYEAWKAMQNGNPDPWRNLTT